MAIIVVGADSLGTTIEGNLQKLGITEIAHITGRNVADRKTCNLSSSFKLVLILTDYINHNTAMNFKKFAKSKGIPFVCSQRSWHIIESKISKLGIKLA
jgi:hypothetical protein